MTSSAIAQRDLYAQIETDLLSRGYAAPKLLQLSRNMVATIQSEGRTLLFKMATFPGRNFSNYSELLWYDLVRNSASPDAPMHIPRIHDIGSFDGGRLWFVCDYFDGPDLAKLYSDRGMMSTAWIDVVVSVLRELTLLKTDIQWTPADEWRLAHAGDQVDVRIWMHKRAHSCLNQMVDCPFSVEPLLKAAFEADVSASASLQHGNFVPRHLFTIDGGRLGLVDAEQGGRFLPHHHDAAYFYENLYAIVGRPDTARVFLKRYWQAFATGQDQREFQAEFRVVLAHRVVGGLSDATQYRRGDLPNYERLIHDIVTANLF